MTNSLHCVWCCYILPCRFFWNVGTFLILKKVLCHAVFCCNCCGYQLRQVLSGTWELLLFISQIKWWYWRHNYFPGIFCWKFWTGFHPCTMCWHLSLKSQHICAVEEYNLTKYQVNSFPFIPDSTPQIFSGSVSLQPQ